MRSGISLQSLRRGWADGLADRSRPITARESMTERSVDRRGFGSSHQGAGETSFTNRTHMANPFGATIRESLAHTKMGNARTCPGCQEKPRSRSVVRQLDLANFVRIR